MAHKKGNIIKTTILLILLVLLAVSVCFSEVYAWFYELTAAEAGISGKVLSFNFTANGAFNEDIEFTAGEEIGENTFVYLKDPKTGMFPGQIIRAELTISNKQSNVPVRYKINVKGSDANHYPIDCLLTVKNSDNRGYIRWTIKDALKITDTDPANSQTPTAIPVYPIAGNGETNNVASELYAQDTTYAVIAAGEERKLTIEIEWPCEYSDIPSGASDYADAEAKNNGDWSFMEQSVNTDTGEKIKDFNLVLEIFAEQLP